MPVQTEEYPLGEVIRFDKSNPSDLVERYKHHKKIPKDPIEHLKWRIWLRRKANEEPKFRKVLKKWCEEDPIFFINALCWIDEPRGGQEQSGLIPFNSWPHQDPVIAGLAFFAGRRHSVIDKSRAQGASWIVLCIILWLFLFRKRAYMGMSSITQALADDPDSPESLGWKFDHLLEHLPRWLTHDEKGDKLWERSITDSSWTHRITKSSLKAHAGTKGIGRAGRYLLYFLDEASFFCPGSDTEAVNGLTASTDNIILASTPNGADTEHAKRLEDPGYWLTLILDWTDNPAQNKCLYSVKDGVVTKLDEEEYPPGYYPIMDELFPVRSVWFDRFCLNNRNNVVYINRELNRDRGGSRAKPFDKASLDLARHACVKPNHVGYLVHDDSAPKEAAWVDDGNRAWSLWVELQNGRPPRDEYIFGADIALGAGGDTSSNSVLSVWNKRGVQVASFARHDIEPTDFAQLAYAALHWFSRDGRLPLIVPERNAGGGALFIKELIRLGYSNVYRPPKKGDKETGARSDKFGYHNSNRLDTLGPLIRAIKNGTATPRDVKLLDEAGEYVFDGNGNPVHPKSLTSEDGSARGMNHGDRAIAGALAMRGIESLGGIKSEKAETMRQPLNLDMAAMRLAPPGSIGHAMWTQQKASQKNRVAAYEF